MDDPRRAVLEGLGYTVCFRTQGWVECLLARAGERWFGAGVDASGAFADALAKALPSAVAQHAFAGLLERGAPGRAAAAPVALEREPEAAAAGAPLPVLAPEVPAASPAVAVPHEVPGMAVGSEPRVPRAAVPAAAEAPSAAIQPVVISSVANQPAGQDPATEPVAVPAVVPPAAERTLALAPAPQPETTAPVEPAEHLEPEAAHAELDELVATIERNHREASLLVPLRQRLLLTQWMARARAIEAACPEGRGLHSRVYELSQTLGKLSKIWWPGSVKVLAMACSPSDCRHDVAADPEPVLRTWRDVEQAAAASLERAEELASAQGADEFGWFDHAALSPPPEQPAVLLERVRRSLEAYTAPPLLRPTQVAHASLLQPSHLPTLPREPQFWIDLVGTVRWLRGAPRDAELWGAALGRLRWLAEKVATLQLLLQPRLEPRHQPTGSWFRALGHERRAQDQRAVQLLAAVPEDREALVGWLAELLGLADVVTTERLATVLAPRRADLAALSANGFGERNLRRRFKKLLEKLGVATTAAAGPETEGAAVVATAASPTPPPKAAAELAHAAHLRPYTVGKRALFVSNRSDSQRDEQLRLLLGLAEIEACLLDPSRVQGKEQAIRRGSFDFVLAATGFLPHKIDGMLKGACRESGTRYVRVNRGRVLQCLMHLERELGLAGQPQATAG
jgi:hypothetical protein